MNKLCKYILCLLILFSGSLYADNRDRVKCNQGDQSGEQGSGGKKKNESKSREKRIKIPVLRPVDPNEIVGPQGYVDVDSSRWVSTKSSLGYTVYYENDPEMATASAQRVEIRYHLDDGVDAYSLGIGNFGFGNLIFPVNDAPKIYQERLDVRDSLGLYVDVVAGVDLSKREIFWLFSSIDPATNLPPTGSDEGFLPVNDKTKHNGEGFVTFVMKTKPEIVTGDSVKAKASIVFDSNEAIETNEWKNVLDAVAPTSTFTATAQKDRPTFYDFRFKAEDDPKGVGVKQVVVYMSQNKEAYKECAVCSPDSIWTFESESGSEYAFFTQAVDSTDNKEEFKDKADFTIQSNVAPTDLILSETTFQDDIAAGAFIGELTTKDTGGDTQKFTYALAEGEGAIHNDLFRIEGNHLLVATSFRNATETTYKIRLQTTDVGGLTFSKAFVLTMKQVLATPEPKVMDVGICEGESYDFFGTSYNQTGTYTYRKANEAMRDSVYVLNLQVDPIPAKPSVTISGIQLISSALTGNQWFDENGVIEGATGQTFVPSISGNYFVVVSNGGCESEPSDTYYVNLSGEQKVTWSFREGWNWVSVNLKNLTDPKAFIKPVQENVQRILGQTQELTKDPAYGLVGELATLEPTTLYKVQMSSSASLAWDGDAYAPEDLAIKLNKGWNWLGYVPSIQLTPDVAFAEAHPVRGDEVKGQEGFAQYDGSRWIGSLSELQPGKGYMYHSLSEKTFHYSNAKGTVLRKTLSSVEAGAHGWSFDPYKYPNNMSVVAAVYDGEMKMEPGIYSVGAFVGNECRGVGVYADGYLFISVYGGINGEKVTFKAFENTTGEELKIKEVVHFSEATVGSLNTPFALHLLGSSTVDVEEIGNLDLTVYPNPVRSRLTIGGDYQLVKAVQVLDMAGHLMIQQKMNGANTIDMSILSDGAYVVVLETKKGLVYKKVLKAGNTN